MVLVFHLLKWDFFKLSMWDLVQITEEDFFTVAETYEEVSSINQAKKNILSCIAQLLNSSWYIHLCLWNPLYITYSASSLSNTCPSLICLLFASVHLPEIPSIYSVHIQTEHTYVIYVQFTLCHFICVSLSACLSFSLSHTHSHKTSLPEPNRISTRPVTPNCIFFPWANLKHSPHVNYEVEEDLTQIWSSVSVCWNEAKWLRSSIWVAFS